jgi:hypothetical protein
MNYLPYQMTIPHNWTLLLAISSLMRKYHIKVHLFVLITQLIWVKYLVMACYKK